MRRFIVHLSLIVVVLLALVTNKISTQAQEATPAATTVRVHVLRIGRVGFPDSFDPQRNSASFAVPSLVYEGLTKLDEQLNTVPAAAESWNFSDDGLTVTFHLRGDLIYNDGSPITAERFRYAVERDCDPRTAAPYVHLIFVIAGCEAFATSLPTAEGEERALAATPVPQALAAYEAARANLGVRALDDWTLEIELVHPAA